MICWTSTWPKRCICNASFCRPCCPANFFLGSARGMPTAPPQDAPACVQRLNARALRCLQRFHEKHSQHLLSSEARINVISSLKLYTSLLCFIKPSQNGIEHKSLANFCAGRGTCTDVKSGAEKFTLGSRTCFGGTGYSWPGLFSGSLQMHTRFNTFTVDKR